MGAADIILRAAPGGTRADWDRLRLLGNLILRRKGHDHARKMG